LRTRGGRIIFAGVILVFLVILAVGGLMYRKMGPPPTP
jgi:high-affinity K+ transport system ATPase subunit B